MAECGPKHRAILRRKLDLRLRQERLWFECTNCGKRWGWNDWIVNEAERTVRLGDLFEFAPEEGPEFLDEEDFDIN